MINHTKVSQLVDLISALNSYHAPDTEAYQHRNPGLLKTKTKELKKFACTVDGLRALTDSVEKQCQWNPTFTVSDLLCLYEVQPDEMLVIDYFQDNILEQRVSFFQE